MTEPFACAFGINYDGACVPGHECQSQRPTIAACKRHCSHIVGCNAIVYNRYRQCFLKSETRFTSEPRDQHLTMGCARGAAPGQNSTSLKDQWAGGGHPADESTAERITGLLAERRGVLDDAKKIASIFDSARRTRSKGKILAVWAHVVPWWSAFPVLHFIRGTKEYRDEASLIVSEELPVEQPYNVSHWASDISGQRALVARARAVLKCFSGAWILVQHDQTAEILRPLGPRVATPSQEVFDAFESRTNGKRGTADWLKRHGLGRFAIREFRTDALLVMGNRLNSKELNFKARTKLQRLQRVSVPTWPIVVKPLRGSGGHGIHIVPNASSFPAALALCRETARARQDPDARCISQEAILGETEWGIYFVAYNGTVRCWFEAPALQKCARELTSLCRPVARRCRSLTPYASATTSATTSSSGRPLAGLE